LWNNAGLLAQVGGLAIWVSAIAAMIATAAGLLGGVAANRANDLTTRTSNERIAAANARAEEAKTETVRLWSQMAWRRVTPEQAAAIKLALTGETFRVWTCWVGTDPESAIYGEELSNALTLAGLESFGFRGVRVSTGLVVAGPESAEKTRLITALQSANIWFTVEGPTELFPGLVLIVGSKTEPVSPKP
jgi:hypothetical protein